MTRFRAHLAAGTVGLAALVALAAPASGYFSGLAGWAGACAQSQGMAPGCGQIPPRPRGPAMPQVSPEEQQIEEQQRREQQEALDRLQQQREEQERQARDAEVDDLAGLDLQARGDLQGAIDKFIAALDLAPGNATIQEHLRRANIALAAGQSSAAIDALRHRIENVMASARISALQKDMEAKMLSRRLVAFYNSFLTAQAAPSQAKVDCVANSGVVFWLKLNMCQRQNLALQNCLRGVGLGEKTLACLGSLPLAATPASSAYVAFCGGDAVTLPADIGLHCMAINDSCLDDALKEQKTRTAACSKR
jgi:tetratricopeptide (TPR) repeat protein